MKILDNLGLPTLNEYQLEELIFSKNIYSVLDVNKDKRLDVIARKKALLSDIFDLFVGYFNLDFNLKLTFNRENESLLGNDYMYINLDLNKRYDELVYLIYKSCFKRYLSNLYLYSEDISEDSYMLLKLIDLNDDDKMFDNIANILYMELIANSIDSDLELNINEISKEDIKKLLNDNQIRKDKLLEEVRQYSLINELSLIQVRKVYNCFAMDIFSKLSNDDKNHLINLLYNYFTDSKSDRYKDYSKLINEKTDNILGLKILIDDLLKEMKTKKIVNRFTNKRVIENVLSYVNKINSNEINKENINRVNVIREMYLNNKKLAK